MKYFLITFGCQMNKSDSERISSVLEKIGYRPVLKEDKADLIVVNMCSVRQSAVDRVYGLAKKFNKIKRQKPKLKTILTGCILKKDKEKFAKIFDSILDIKDLKNWPKIIKKQSYKNKENTNLSFSCEYLKIKPKHQSNLLAFVPISTGCNNFCTYCVVPFTRGKLVCRNHKEILKEIKNLVKKGYKEIWLLGQNVNDYHSPINTNLATNFRECNINIGHIRDQISANSRGVNFAKLIKMVNNIPGNFKFFFTSPHPKNFSDELIEVLAKSKKFGKILNLPVQSGDNEILKRMNRNYTIEQYKELINKIRKKIPDIKLSTDVIVGFPGETKKHFENTVKLFKEIKFDWAYIAKYSPRPDTAAAKLKDNVSLKEKKRREKILRNLIGRGKF